MTVILAIGGTDSSGGAGISRDVTAAAQLGVMVRPVVTCVTAQTDQAVEAVHAVPADLIGRQMQAALGDAKVGAVKIGMVGAGEVASAISGVLEGCDLPVIFDPVIRASSGGMLSDKLGLSPIITRAELVTPNLDEAAWLSGEKTEDLNRQARLIRGSGTCAVLVKGGHGTGENSCDVLFQGDRQLSFCGPRLSQSRRGTGCTLATYIACFRALGLSLPAACGRAREMVQDYIATGHEKSRL